MQNRRSATAEVLRKVYWSSKKQLEDVRLLLAQKIQEAQTMADSFVELGERLKREPWRWVIGESTVPPPPGLVTMPLEYEMIAALDRERLKRLLDEIRWLQREEARLSGEANA